jgi:hypothetical protein
MQFVPTRVLTLSGLIWIWQWLVLSFWAYSAHEKGLQYPHWLMVAGAVFVVLGIIGFSISQKARQKRRRMGWSKRWRSSSYARPTPSKRLSLRRPCHRSKSSDWLFENFERNQTHLWSHEEDTRGSRHEIQVLSDEGMLLKSFDIREIVKDAGLKFLGRRVDVQSWEDGWLSD